MFRTQLAIKRPFKYPPHPMCASAQAGENGKHEMRRQNKQKKTSKNIPDIIDCNVTKDDQI